MSIKANLWRRAQRALQRRSGQRMADRIGAVGLALYRAANNASYDFTHNGEARALGLVLRHFPRNTVFDVGANVGNWTREAVSFARPEDRVLAFEPSSATFAQLTAATAELSQVRCFNLGLSNRDGPQEMMVSAVRSQKSSVEAASVAALDLVDDYVRETISFRRGAAFCGEQAIDEITFLKIDTEGHDWYVIEGFAEMLAAGRIQAIQFEYNRLNIFTKRLLHDFYALLNPPSAPDAYAIGRIFPQSVRFKKYAPQDETFIDGNFLAVRREHAALIKSLAG
jgi:FkbM family methyltransferase